MSESLSGMPRLRGPGEIRRKAVSLTDIPLVNSHPLNPGETFIRVYEPASSDVDIADWVAHNREQLESDMMVYGGLFLRGFNIKSVAEFEKIALTFYGELYGGYGDLPRAGTSEKIYQSTPYPPDKPILFHNESSHLNSWPMKISFACMQKAQTGGATPLLDSREICTKLDPNVVAKFADKGLMYVRNFSEGIDVNWRSFFHTDDKSIVEGMCREAGVEIEWTDDDELRTRQITHAVVRHPKTGDQLFFNQVQLHHIYCLDPDVRESLLSLFGEKRLPRQVYYGDGTVIEDSVMEHIGQVYDAAAVRFDWQEGDVALLDNMRTAHARDTYSGPRKIVVAMGQMISKQDLN